MPTKKSSAKQKLYKCKHCGFGYREKKWQRACEAWCSKHNSCNIMITRHVVKK
ncbi:MAG: hypothetical protein HYW26_04130 [Candidatus Aenigmarchaeota archaeon]|nr:hypothetical protein [Candidatus Aenigmarchaeota archaeon]